MIRPGHQNTVKTTKRHDAIQIWGRGGSQISSKTETLAAPSPKPKATDNTRAIGHTAKINMTRHGFVAPTLVPSGIGSPLHHGRPPAKHGRALFVYERAVSRFLVFEAGHHCCATNSTSTSLDDLDVELVPGLYDIGGHQASREDVWACDVAPGNLQNT